MNHHKFYYCVKNKYKIAAGFTWKGKFDLYYKSHRKSQINKMQLNYNLLNFGYNIEYYRIQFCSESLQQDNQIVGAFYKYSMIIGANRVDEVNVSVHPFWDTTSTNKISRTNDKTFINEGC